MYPKRGWLAWIIAAITAFGLLHQILYGKEGILTKEDIVYESNIKELDYPEAFRIEIEKARWKNMMNDLKSLYEEKLKDIIVKWGEEHTIRLEKAGITLEQFVWLFMEDEDIIEKLLLSHSQREELKSLREDAAVDIMAEMVPEMQTFPIRAQIPNYKIEYK